MSTSGSVCDSSIPTEAQRVICRELWNSTEIVPQSYFRYYTSQCKVVCQPRSRWLASRRHQHVIDTARDIGDGLSRGEVLDRLSERSKDAEHPATDEQLGAFTDLVARLLTMVEIGEIRNAFTGRRQLFWANESLELLLHDEFNPKVASVVSATKKDGTFTARNLERIAGLEVQLTSNLADHLRFRDDRTVAIFHHASFLKCQKLNPVFPSGFIEETIRTLALLFPPRCKKTEAWYKKRRDIDQRDPDLFLCGSSSSQIADFTFWQDRLAILRQEFDESTPSTFRRLWSDKRHGPQWFSIWLVLGLTVLFGIIQSIEGALQVYKAWHPASG